ncbi:hypothetical protein K502DRAFT_290838 [Neoconidiobolus thromboides FSU 785]|nr:hypothetical protein K502DRAFT_290838 [Neoconidiobolus thromboides FSU 785]
MLSQLKNNNIDAIIPAHQLTLDEITEEPGKDEKLNLAEAILAPVKSDREDQLISTCVVDQLGTCLGLVYSNYSSVLESLKTGQGVYFSRKRGLWHKGITSGSHQHLLKIEMDCDFDTLKFTVIQHGSGFCHLETLTCFGKGNGLVELERTIQSRKNSAPEGSYTHRLFTDPSLLNSKIMEEAEELCQAENKNDVTFEAADLMYFLMVKCAMVGSRLGEVLNNLQKKSLKVQRRAGDAKPKWLPKIDNKNLDLNQMKAKLPTPDIFKVKEPTWPLPYQLTTYNHDEISENERQSLLKRPILNNKEIFNRVDPILQEVRQKGDSAILEFTAKFDQVELEETCMVAPFPSKFMKLSPETKQAIDKAYENILKFHLAQKEKDTILEVETSNGVICTRFSRAIERVGLYVPGGTAVLPSTALMLGIPAKVAGCSEIIFATPPRKDGTIAPEVVYVAEKVGATHILKAGGAQAVAALAYGTNTVPKVDKICGPGNQYVTCAKMIVQNDPSNLVSIDMPAGPSEILVIADATSNPKFVASDLLSQAEHGEDSQSVLVTVGLDEAKIQDILKEVESQAKVLPRKDIIEKSLAHSFLLTTENQEQAIAFSNDYAPEHLIIQTDEPHQWMDKIVNAGSVFLGHYSPESCGDYASGTNHTLPTYGYARMYSGVGTSTFQKYITSQYLSKEGIRDLGPIVMHLAEIEGLEAHSNAVRVRLESLQQKTMS